MLEEAIAQLPQAMVIGLAEGAIARLGPAAFGKKVGIWGRLDPQVEFQIFQTVNLIANQSPPGQGDLGGFPGDPSAGAERSQPLAAPHSDRQRHPTHPRPEQQKAPDRKHRPKQQQHRRQHPQPVAA